MSTLLPTHTTQGRAAPGSYGTAALGFTIPSNAENEAHATFRNTGTADFWYIQFNRSSGPTTTSYSKKLGPNESFTITNPPIGDVYFLAGASANGDLDWEGDWA